MKSNSYNYDVINNTLTLTASFAKQASQLNTPEYKTLLQFRKDNPDLKIEMKEVRKSQNSSSIGFAQMEKFIGQCREADERLKAFERVKALSKVQRSPYKYVKEWFLTNYANYSGNPEFDADNYVIVKTKAQMEQEAEAAKKTAAAANDGAAARGDNIATLEPAAKEDNDNGEVPVSKAA